MRICSLLVSANFQHMLVQRYASAEQKRTVLFHKLARGGPLFLGRRLVIPATNSQHCGAKTKVSRQLPSYFRVEQLMFWQRIFTLQIKTYQRRQKVTQITTQKCLGIQQSLNARNWEVQQGIPAPRAKWHRYFRIPPHFGTFKSGKPHSHPSKRKLN